MCDEKKIGLQARFTEAASLAAPLAGRAPEEEDEVTWRRRIWSAARPKLEALADLKRVCPADPEPLKGAFLLARYKEIYLAQLTATHPDATRMTLSDFYNPYAEPDPLEHAERYRRTHPGVDGAVAAYVTWRESVAGLGAAEMARVAEMRAELSR